MDFSLSPAASLRRGAPRLMIWGLGRSGTSWLSKIFDSHPDTFTVHEPETRVNNRQPGRAAEAPAMTAAAAEALQARYAASRALNAMRKRPVFTKSYRRPLAHRARLGLIHALSGLRAAGRAAGLNPIFPVPDLIAAPPGLVVVKGVGDALGYIDAAPLGAGRTLFLIRHPAAVALSTVRGQATGKMGKVYLPARAALTPYAPSGADPLALTEDALTQAQVIAYRWAAMNDRALAAARAAPGKTRVLRYEDLAADPVGVARDLFAWAGLDWRAECDRFLAPSLAETGDATGYHDLIRNPAVAASAWRKRIAPEMRAAVEEIAGRSEAFRLYADDRAAAPD